MTKLFRICLFVFLVGLSSTPAFAALVFRIGNGEIDTGAEVRNPIRVTQGKSGSIRFSATADGESFSIDGYNIYFDVGDVDTGPNGFSAPAGIDFTGASPVPGGFNSDGVVRLDVDTAVDANLVLNIASGTSANYDFIVDDARSGGLLLNDGETTNLLDLNFDVAISAAPGIYDVLFVASPSLVPANVNAFHTAPNARALQAFGGSIEVVAVPEPSSMMALGAVMVVGVLTWRRRRQIKLV
ncbi:PEP-CTERM sorting domain-containing protein [Rubripirellula amarantea]|nr:PEP-CTERM sorting domain-containing protein [Rubripirellula amarantea]